MNRPLISTLAALAVLATAAPARAQLGDLFNRVVPGLGPLAPPGNNGEAPDSGSAPPATRPGAAPAAPPVALPGAPAATPSKSAAMVGGDQGVAPLKGVRVELPPDRQCNRPQERFNIAEKLMEYGGTEATLRLERLVKSDYKYSDLTPQDRQMLQYIARTTIWLPVEVEGALGKAFSAVSSSGGEPLTEVDEQRQKDAQVRLDGLLAAVSDFPGSVKLVTDPKLADGAAAKFGGVILLSKRFLETMAEKPAGGDFVLAHELSHVYKRHAIKQMQFTMISTDEGWDLGKKLLERGMRGTQANLIQDTMFTVTTVPKLIEFVRGLQLKFGAEQELEADACSVVWLRSRNIDPGSAWDEFETAYAVANSLATTYGITHPPTTARKANVKAKVGGAGAKPAPVKPDKAGGKPPVKKAGG